MQYISFLVQHFYATKFQTFTERLASAISIFEAIKGDTEDEKLKKDYDRLLWIGENTHKNLMVSIYKLDLYVNPSNKEFKTVMNKIRLSKNGEVNEDGSNKTITLTEDTIQYYLCKSGVEINQIVSRNIKPYSDEFKIGDFGKDDDDVTGFDKLK